MLCHRGRNVYPFKTLTKDDSAMNPHGGSPPRRSLLYSQIFKRTASVAVVLLMLIGIFFNKNILHARPTIPFDLLYTFDPWKSEAPNALPQNPELFDQVVAYYPWWTLIVDEVKHGRLPS